MIAQGSLLDAPPAAATFEMLPELWRTTTLEALFALPADFDEGPSLPGRIRGAWGVRLARWTAGGRADAAALREGGFGPAPVWRGQRAIPRPYAIAAERDPAGIRLRVRLSLFGFADAFRDVAFDALLAAVSSGEGLAIGPDPGARRVRLPLISADWQLRRSIPSRPLGPLARLLFRTPLRLGPRHALGLRYSDIIVSAADRVAALARWQGLAVEPSLSAWRDVAKRLVFDDGTLRAVAWTRRSGAQAGRAVPMAGLCGALDIRRPPESIAPLLIIGEQIHVGAGTSLGLGRFDLL